MWVAIFDKYPLLTSKRFNYLNFKSCLLINENNNISQFNKWNNINNIKKLLLNNNYISDVWNIIKLNNIINYSNLSINNINNIITKSWLIGFIETEGLFFILNKLSLKLVHSFSITKNIDYIVLYSIKLLLIINNNIKNENNYLKLETLNIKNIEYIIKYFRYSNYLTIFLGIKSFEFKIWIRSYNKYKNNYLKLNNVKNIIKRYRKNV